MLSWSWRSIKLLLLHLVGVPYYFTYSNSFMYVYIYIYSNLVREKFQHYIKKTFLKMCSVVLGRRAYAQNRQDSTMKATTGCLHQLVNLSHWIQAINIKKQCDCDVRLALSRIIILRRSSGKTSDSSDMPTCCEHADGHASGILMLVFRTLCWSWGVDRPVVAA
jgi:hypothetical protein